jgi:alkylation response protein AidB-like acyl-CoA dehydrogenase
LAALALNVPQFAVTDEQQMLAETLGRLLRETNEFEVRRKRLSGNAPDRLALWPALADVGAIAAAFSEAHGGFAGDARTIAVVMAEIGTTLAVEPYLATGIVAGHILQNWSNAEARQVAIDAVIDGSQIIILAHNPAGDPFAGLPLIRTGHGDRAMISGSVGAVRHGDVAHRFLVPVSAGDQSLEIYIVPREIPGLTIESYRLIDSAGAADLHFTNVNLSAAMRLNFDASARQVLDGAIEWGLLGLAAETAGIVAALNQATFSYLMTREQFGTAIGNFQALQHRAANMWIAAEELLAIVELAIDNIAGAPSNQRDAIISATKVIADKSGRLVGNDAVQLHGGMGVSDELIVSHYFRRLAAIRTEYGSHDAHRIRFRSKQ